MLILNFFNLRHLDRLLVLISNDDPSLVGMAVVLVTLVAARFKKRAIVVDPVQSLFVDDRDQHLEVRWGL